MRTFSLSWLVIAMPGILINTRYQIWQLDSPIADRLENRGRCSPRLGYLGR